jgi:ATP-dependent DNA helicase RecQ
VDRELNEYLREWRRSTAKEKGIPAFVVLHDSALEDLCLVEPSNLQELRRVSGFGEKKVEMYGKEILDVLRRFRQGERATNEGKQKVSSPAKETLRLLEEGRTFEEIAQLRARTLRPSSPSSPISSNEAKPSSSPGGWPPNAITRSPPPASNSA